MRGREAFNEVKWKILENVFPAEKARLRDLIMQKADELQTAFPEGTPDDRYIFLGNETEGFKAALLMPNPSSTSDNRFIATLFERPITAFEKQRVKNALNFTNLPVAADIDMYRDGRISSTFDMSVFPLAKKCGTPYAGKYVPSYQHKTVIFMTSPIDKVSLNYLRIYHTVLTNILVISGNPQGLNPRRRT